MNEQVIIHLTWPFHISTQAAPTLHLTWPFHISTQAAPTLHLTWPFHISTQAAPTLHLTWPFHSSTQAAPTLHLTWPFHISTQVAPTSDRFPLLNLNRCGFSGSLTKKATVTKQFETERFYSPTHEKGVLSPDQRLTSSCCCRHWC